MGKLLNYSGAIFDPVVMRWYYGNTEQYQVQSEVFKKGYEDPTYMTFRVEFGEWGASILHRNTFTMHGGLVLNAQHQDYDQLPNGLLDLHFAEDTIKGYPNYAFNNQTYYNAYNYLLQRNEDTRAEYLKAFVTGLYEIQKDHPYLFQSISGLDGLSNFSPESGQRLNKDTFVTIECIEGLSLKVKTLLQLYRKAAWDDAWQRWVLPLNMRQFKMIIYVFERRTFQDVTNVNSLSSIKQAHTVNNDIPVYAFECNPCEFVIENIWNSDYDATWGGDAEKTKITIRVSNVMTYYRNGLLDDKLNTVLIYDLLDAIDRSKLTGAYNANVNNVNGILFYETPNEVKGNFLRKNIILENEDMNKAIKKERITYGLGDDILEDYPGIAEPYFGEVTNAMLSHSLLAERVKANWWHEATVEGRDYWSSMSGWDGLFGGGTWRNIGKGLWNVITAATTQIRVSQNYSTHNSTVFYNILDYIETEGSPAEETYSMATEYILPVRKDLKHNADAVTRGETSWATREVGKGKFRDQIRELDAIDSEALTENDYSWATDDKDAEGNHDWTKFRDNPDKRQKSKFNWNKIDSSTMTGGDFSWATTDYNEAGNVKGNDWQNSAQYKSSEVPRQKNGFVWNNIDSKTLTGGDFSWATDDKNNPTDHKWEDFDKGHMQDGQRQKQAFVWNSIDSNKLSENEKSKATKDGNKIQEGLNRDLLTEYDYSWATKGEGQKEHDSNMTFRKPDNTERNSVIDKPIESGGIDSADLTNYDYSWATQDLMNEYDHPVKIKGGGLDTSIREQNNNIQVSLEDPRLDPSLNLIPLKRKDRKGNNEIQYPALDTSRGFEKTFKSIDFSDREMNEQLPPTLERESKDFVEPNLRTVDDTERGINEEIIFAGLDERTLNTDIVYDPLKERKLSKPEFRDIDNERTLPESQFGEIQGTRNIDRDIQMKLENPRSIPEQIMNNTEEERKIDSNLRETDFKGRTINQNVEPLEYQDREQNNNVHLQIEDARDLPKYQNNQNILEERKIIDQALRQPDKELIRPEHSLTSVDTHKRGINDNSYFSLQNTERFIDNNIQIENYEARVINEQQLRSLSDEERKQVEVVLNRPDILNYISKATNAAFNTEFRKIDQESSRIDATAKGMLQNSEAFKNLQYDENIKDKDLTQVLAFAKAYSDESDAMKNAFITRIQGLQKELKEQTLNTVRDIPEMEYQIMKDEKSEKQEPILLSVEQVEQIKNNVKLASLADAEIRDLSYKGLISLHDALENNIVKTMILQKPDTVDDRSIATDLDNPPKPIINGKINQGEDKGPKKIVNSKVEEVDKPEKPILNGKVEDNNAKNQYTNISNAKIEQPTKKKRPILGHRLDDKKYKKEGQ